MFLQRKKGSQGGAPKRNPAGIPAQLKRRLEENTALALDDVRIHYNSDRPARLDALAYTKGNQVYLGPGQERHLPHELGHVVQQKLGLVRPDTRHASGELLNTSRALERQADRIGAGSERIPGLSADNDGAGRMTEQQAVNDGTGRVTEQQAVNVGAGRVTEQQAVNDGAGRVTGAQIRFLGGETVQRMSVFEGMAEETVPPGSRRNLLPASRRDGKIPVPKIVRYKRSGWRAIRKLKQYLTEESIGRLNMGQLAELSRSVPELDESIFDKVAQAAKEEEPFAYEPQFYARLRGKASAVEKSRAVFHDWNREAGQFRGALEQCGAVLGEETNAAMQVTELEKRGRYQKLDSGEGEKPEVDPYFHFKKMALYCIAQKASSYGGPEGRSVGPHIAVTAMNGRIYVSNNSHFALNRAEASRISRTDMETLLGYVRRAINEINSGEVRQIMRRELIPGAKFELGQEPGKESDVKGILEWIEKIRGYKIVVPDVPDYRALPAGRDSPIHGEMTIMGYLRKNPGELAGREARLEEIESAPEGARRIIWMGGTRVDCAKCHEHFASLNRAGRLGRNYVVSSKYVGNEGVPFPHTEEGTGLEDKAANADELFRSPNVRETVKKATVSIAAQE